MGKRNRKDSGENVRVSFCRQTEEKRQDRFADALNPDTVEESSGGGTSE